MGIRPRKPEVLDAFGERIVAGFRFLLAGSALLIVYLDPFEQPVDPPRPQYPLLLHRIQRGLWKRFPERG